MFCLSVGSEAWIHKCLNDTRLVLFSVMAIASIELCHWHCLAPKIFMAICVWEQLSRLCPIIACTVLTVLRLFFEIFPFSLLPMVSSYVKSVVDGTSSEMVHLFAFSKAFGIDIQSYCCPFSLSSPHPYTLQIHSSSYAQAFSTGNVTLMWTPLDTDKEPNHFVLLVPYGESTGLNSVIESAESPSAAEIPNDEMNVSNSCPEENEVLFRFLHYLLLRFCSP